MSFFLQIAIPMKFTGDGHVELRPPKNMEDLKAYTALSLSLQRPEGAYQGPRGDFRRRRRQTGDKDDMFVLYLGNRDVSDSKCIWMFLWKCVVSNCTQGINKLCLAVFEELHRYGSEEEFAVRCVQAQRSRIRDENRLHHRVCVWDGQFR